MQSLDRQIGLSLIELMIGILLSSILLLGVLQIFDSNRRTMSAQVAFSSVQENGRFAMDFLTREVRLADYWGCTPDQDSITNHLDGNTSSAFQSSIGGSGVQGIDNVGDSEKVDGLDVIEDTDVLVLGGTVDACGGTGRLVDTAGASLEVTSNCSVEAGQVVLVANCRGGDVVTVTGVSGDPGDGSNRTVSHETGQVDPDWVQNTSDTLSQSYGADSKLLLPYQHTFFLSLNDTGSPSLFMFEEGSGSPRELVSGIDDMQILYGRDTNGDEIADIWQGAVSDLDQMNNVTVLKIQLIVASASNAGIESQTIPDIDGNDRTYTDGRMRKLYTTTIKVRNRGSM